MRQWVLFTRDEVQLFLFEVLSKFRDGIRSPDALLYIVVTLCGVAGATWMIPAFNRTHTSPETFGIYVIGFLVTLFLDAMFTWKKGSEKPYEQAIAVLCACAAFVMIFIAARFSVARDWTDPPEAEPIWRSGAYFALWTCFILTVLMSLIVSGFEAKPPRVSPLDVSVEAVESRNG